MPVFVDRATEKRAHDGDVATQMDLAERNYKARNFKDAAQWYRMAARLGNTRAMVKLGQLYADAHFAVTQDSGSATDWFREAAKAGDAEGAYRLGLLLLVGEGVPQVEGEALRMLRQGAEHGVPGALKALVDLYLEGQGGASLDDPDAARWLEAAAEGGYDRAQFALAESLEQGRTALSNPVPRNPAQAAHWYHAAAKQEHTAAAFRLAELLLAGRGLAKQPEEAAKWLHIAAEDGHAQALFRLGALYEAGLGVEQDHDEALLWFRLAAEQDVVEAISRVAAMYEHGRGCVADPARAAEWYRRAAEQGDGKAMFNLAVLHVKAIGVVRHLPRAHMWFSVAAKCTKGDLQMRAIESRARLEKQMSREELAEASKLAAER